MSEGSPGQSNRTDEADATEDWPSFALRYTFNPDQSVRQERFDPDELFVFDPNQIDGEEAGWITAERGAYVAIEDVR